MVHMGRWYILKTISWFWYWHGQKKRCFWRPFSVQNFIADVTVTGEVKTILLPIAWIFKSILIAVWSVNPIVPVDMHMLISELIARRWGQPTQLALSSVRLSHFWSRYFADRSAWPEWLLISCVLEEYFPRPCGVRKWYEFKGQVEEIWILVFHH